MNTAAARILNRYGVSPEQIDPLIYADKIAEDMRKGLSHDNGNMAMIPTYLSNDGVLPYGKPAAVIDAGGTNFRRALVTFTEEECLITDYDKFRMPGIEKPTSWDEFITFTADKVEPLMDRTDCIGFCFSYEADITPEMDGKVVIIDKEVKISDAKGKLVGKCLSEELARRGYPGKKVVILNDTVAVLLGGSADLDKSSYSGFIGQVSGTGTNTCCIVPGNEIGKIDVSSPSGMIVNMESGSFLGLPHGIIDSRLDAGTDNPGIKLLEKKTAGVYLGGLVRLLENAAFEEKLISVETHEKFKMLGSFDASYVDAWSEGKMLDELTDNEIEKQMLSDFSQAVVKRSATVMSAILLGITKYTNTGDTPEKPACDCAEGSLVQKCSLYRETLVNLLKSFEKTAGKYIELKVVNDSTIRGSAAAALLNVR